MYLIALCDDEPEQLNKTEQMLTEYAGSRSENEFRVERFENAVRLLERIAEGTYLPDLILMDIYIRRINWELRRQRNCGKWGNHCRLVFLTTSREHALDAFEVEASQYLVKPLVEEKLFPLLDRLLTEMQEERKRYVLLRIDSAVQRVAVDGHYIL